MLWLSGLSGPQQVQSKVNAKGHRILSSTGRLPIACASVASLHGYWQHGHITYDMTQASTQLMAGLAALLGQPRDQRLTAYVSIYLFNQHPAPPQCVHALAERPI